MANEELTQRGYLAFGKLKGDTFGGFEKFNIGATTVKELVACGIGAVIPASINFPFSVYKPPKKPAAAKPDCIYAKRKGKHQLEVVAVSESKAPGKFTKDAAILGASEQALFAASAIGARVAFSTNGQQCRYINVAESLLQQKLVYFDEHRDFNPAVLRNLLAGDAGVAKDPKPLAETV